MKCIMLPPEIMKESLELYNADKDKYKQKYAKVVAEYAKEIKDKEKLQFAVDSFIVGEISFELMDEKGIALHHPKK